MSEGCERVRARWLEQFAAAEPAEAAVGVHLLACEGCRAAVEGWQRSASAVRAWGVEATSELRERTLQRLRRRSEELRRRRQAVQLLAGACWVSAAVNLASLRLLWDGAGFVRAWMGWPALAQPALLAAWSALPLVAAGVLLWMAQASAGDERLGGGGYE